MRLFQFRLSDHIVFSHLFISLDFIDSNYCILIYYTFVLFLASVSLDLFIQAWYLASSSSSSLFLLPLLLLRLLLSLSTSSSLLSFSSNLQHTRLIMLDFCSNQGKRLNNKITMERRKWLLWIIQVREPSGGKMNQRHTNRLAFLCGAAWSGLVHEQQCNYAIYYYCYYPNYVKLHNVIWIFCDSTIQWARLQVCVIECLRIRFSKITSTKAFLTSSLRTCLYVANRWNFSRFYFSWSLPVRLSYRFAFQIER